MEGAKPRQHRLLFGAGVLVILILMTQNFLLVQKVQKYEGRIGLMTQEILQLSTLAPGDSIGAFEALDRDSLVVRVNPANGKKKTLLFVFTTWCPSCRRNFSLWDQLLAELKDDDIIVLGISLDSLDIIKRFHAEQSMSFPVYSIVNDTSIALKYKLRGVPQTLLLRENGTVMKVWPGLVENATQKAIQDSVKSSN